MDYPHFLPLSPLFHPNHDPIITRLSCLSRYVPSDFAPPFSGFCPRSLLDTPRESGRSRQRTQNHPSTRSEAKVEATIPVKRTGAMRKKHRQRARVHGYVLQADLIVFRQGLP